MVYASSIAVYGPHQTLDASDPPQTLYGVFKQTNETTALRYFEDFGVRTIGLRPHTVYGPGGDVVRIRDPAEMIDGVIDAVRSFEALLADSRVTAPQPGRTRHGRTGTS